MERAQRPLDRLDAGKARRGVPPCRQHPRQPRSPYGRLGSGARPAQGRRGWRPDAGHFFDLPAVDPHAAGAAARRQQCRGFGYRHGGSCSRRTTLCVHVSTIPCKGVKPRGAQSIAGCQCFRPRSALLRCEMGVRDFLNKYLGGETGNYERGPPPYERNLGDMSWLERYHTLRGTSYPSGFDQLDPRSALAILMMQQGRMGDQQPPSVPQERPNPQASPVYQNQSVLPDWMDKYVPSVKGLATTGNPFATDQQMREAIRKKGLPY